MAKETYFVRGWLLILVLCNCALIEAQDKNKKAPSTKAAQQPSGRATGGPASSRKAITYYADAANFQKNGAFQRAIEDWKKLLSEVPDDPLARKSWNC